MSTAAPGTPASPIGQNTATSSPGALQASPQVGQAQSPGSALVYPANALSVPVYRPGPFHRFFLWMSKTDVQALSHCTYESVATQWAMGAMVLLSGLFALSSSFFLVYSITEGQLTPAWVAPFLYAAAIVLFDRELVGYTPSAELTTWGKFLHMLPRLVFACVIGLAISIPMEHKLMERAIEREIQAEVVRDSADLVQRSIAAQAEIEQIRQQLQKQLETARTRVANIELRLHEEYMKRGGKGPRYAALEEERNREKATLQSAEEKFANFHPTEAQVASAREADKIIAERTKDVRRDVLERTQALGRITQRDSEADQLHWIVRLVFVALELFPMILKLFQKYNEYHAYLEVRRRIAIQKGHVLGNHALEFIDKHPAAAARMELTDLIQAAGEDPITSAEPAIPVSPLAGANPYVKMAPPTSGPPQPTP